MTLTAQLDLITALELEEIANLIEEIENAFNKIDLRRFEE